MEVEGVTATSSIPAGSALAGPVSAGSALAGPVPAGSSVAAKKPHNKRKRRISGDGKQRGGGGKWYRPPHKKAKSNVSSTHAANNIMKFRLGGSVSDPLNLEGGVALSDECSTCAPSPAGLASDEVIPPPRMSTQLDKDPLNLEGKVKNFPLQGQQCALSMLTSAPTPITCTTTGARKGACPGGKAVTAAGQRRKPRRRTTSGSKTEDSASSVSQLGVKGQLGHQPEQSAGWYKSTEMLMLHL